MREMGLFRGKRKDTGEWVYGDLSHLSYGIIAINDSSVIPETVGEYTGLTDVKGVKIFEGDIVLWRYIESSGIPAKETTVVFFEEGGFCIKTANNFYRSGFAPNSSCLYKQCRYFDEAIQKYPQGCFKYEVIGNIHKPGVECEH